MEVAEDIYGPDISALRGRTTWKRPSFIINNNIEIPEEITNHWNNLTLCINNMFVQGQVFLMSINTTMQCRLATHLNNQSARELYSGLDRILRNYNTAGYTIGHIHCNQEFRPILEEVCDKMNIQLHCPPTGNHVPEAEKNI